MKTFHDKKITSASREKGFTLLETLVAISILVLSITATFTAAQSGLSAAVDSLDQVRATYLAQEAVEMVRNTRDSNSLARLITPSVSWMQGLAAQNTDPCYFGKACVVDATAPSGQPFFVACPTGPGSCSNISQDTNVADATYGMYGYASYHPTWTLTNFNREIDLSQGSAGEVIVSVTMKWNEGLVNRTFNISEVIRDWQ